MADQTATVANRRRLIKGLGTGALGLSLLSGTTTAEQASCDLGVSVEAGEGDTDNWVQREYITDDFRGKIDVSGVNSGTELAYMMIPTNPEGGFVGETNIRSDVVEITASSESIVHSGAWNPGGVAGTFGTWPTGTYNLYATVADREQEAFGVAVSEPFEIDP